MEAGPKVAILNHLHGLFKPQVSHVVMQVFKNLKSQYLREDEKTLVTSIGCLVVEHHIVSDAQIIPRSQQPSNCMWFGFHLPPTQSVLPGHLQHHNALDGGVILLC